MRVFELATAKANISRLVDEAASGEPFIIAKGGKPLVKVVRFESHQPRKVRRLGFLEGTISVPDDFDRMGTKKINRLFLT